MDESHRYDEHNAIIMVNQRQKSTYSMITLIRCSNLICGNKNQKITWGWILIGKGLEGVSGVVEMFDFFSW